MGDLSTVVMAIIQVAVLVGAGGIGLWKLVRGDLRAAVPWTLGATAYWSLAGWNCGVLHFFPGSATCVAPLGLSWSVHGAVHPLARLGVDLMALAMGQLLLVALLALLLTVILGQRALAQRPRG